ncbi:hypothetical protein MKI84_01805 [Ancylobacter sp. A5.8]|uniref:hypothetical protein n=1 Tax=Ancylobacter gelatini TaxID=2919920 RepID=UPI001F4E8A67|nr:hypothetical protein [Ancylobacter gelatini]MCJ8141643.1 hypothetical protein [Ancylobacter gelatini]
MSTTEYAIAAPKTRRPPAKKPRISRKMHQALEAYITGTAKTQVEAAAKAGISSEHFCRALKIRPPAAGCTAGRGSATSGVAARDDP